MKKYFNPAKNLWPEIVARPVFDAGELFDKVNAVLNEIRCEGEVALKKYTALFDGVSMDEWQVKREDFLNAENELPQALKKAIDRAAENIRKFHKKQLPQPVREEICKGVVCWQKPVPIETVGLYIPGGTAPLFSTVLMLAIPAQLAGCKEIILCTPPSQNGAVHPAVLYAAHVAGVTQVFKLGGIQAIGAMAYGIVTPKVDKIFGPGNQYVMAAKQLVGLSQTAIDMPAGPSEVAVMTDPSAVPEFVAADMLSQAEHGADSQVILVMKGDSQLAEIEKEIEIQLKKLPRKEMAQKALANSKIIVFDNEMDMIELINLYAPEHLIISMSNYAEVMEKITCAGSVFLGNFSPESVGDYASGTNHTLPTNGWARSFSGVNMDSFFKKITFQEITAEGLKNLGPTIEIMAQAEQLSAHKNAVSVRLKRS